VAAEAGRVPLRQALLYWVTAPFRKMWDSDDPMDAYGLVHMASAAGDALVAIALADSVFFSVPVSETKLKVALFLGLTMAPLAVAAPLLVPLLDRTPFRRALSFASAAGRALAAVFAASRFSSVLLFPLAFAVLVLSRVHAITKNGLTMAYAPAHEGLVRANARLGRIAVAGVALASLPGLAVLKLGGAGSVLYVSGGVYAIAALLVFRLPEPEIPHVAGEVHPRGRVVSLTTSAAGMAGLRGASGFLLFLMAFALRGRGYPAYWFGVLAGCAVVGGFLGDVAAPRLPRALREEVVVFGALLAAGVAAFFAFAAFELWVLALFVGLVGMATEFGRLAFQSLMQRSAPVGAHGRVFVRYEVLFQVSWVAGAFLPAVLQIAFRPGVLILALFYLALGVTYLFRSFLSRRRIEDP
jgi:hypothetical protein